MKKKIGFILVCIYFLLVCQFVFAHPGGVDKNGGHVDKKTGEYHYHNKSTKKKDNVKDDDFYKTDLEAIDNIRKFDKSSPEASEDSSDEKSNESISFSFNSPYLKIGFGVVILLIIAGYYVYYSKTK